MIATRAGASLATVLVGRYALGAVLLALAAGGLARVRLPTAHARRLLLLGGGGQAVIAATSLYALKFLPAGTLAFLFYTYPAWVTVMAAARGSERLTGPRLGALVLSLAGIALIVGSPRAGSIHVAGLVLALSSAFIYALYIPFIGRLQADAPPAVASAYVSAGATGWFVIAAAAGSALLAALHLAPDPWLALSARLTTVAWLAILGLAVFSTMIAFIAFLRGLAVLGPVRTAIVSTVEPFWTASVGALALGQAMSPRAVAGGALIASAVVLLQLTGQRND